MRSTNWLGGSVLIAGLCLAAIPAFAQQQEQSQSQSNSSSSQQQSQDASSQDQTGDAVADAARKAREQQKTTPKPKKVYTDDDVKPATPPPSEAPAAKAASGDSQGAAAEGDASKGDAGSGKDDPETAWKKKFADQRAKISAAEKELDVLQQEEQKAEVQYYPDPQKALTEQYTRQDINDKLAKIDAKKKEIADLKQQLDDMEDELRKSGGDPGWAREP